MFISYRAAAQKVLFAFRCLPPTAQPPREACRRWPSYSSRRRPAPYFRRSEVFDVLYSVPVPTPRHGNHSSVHAARRKSQRRCPVEHVEE